MSVNDPCIITLNRHSETVTTLTTTTAPTTPPPPRERISETFLLPVYLYADDLIDDDVVYDHERHFINEFIREDDDDDDDDDNDDNDDDDDDRDDHSGAKDENEAARNVTSNPLFLLTATFPRLTPQLLYTRSGNSIMYIHA